LVPYEKNEFDAKIKDVKVQIASTASDESEYINELQNISKVVLEPIADKLKEYNKLIIIPDGMLNCIPFTLLAQPSQEEYRPLISDYEVTLFPSISFMIRERNSEYKSASEKLLAFADPFYGSRKVPEAYRGDAEVFYKRAVNSFNLFTPLPETRTEVENISNLFKPEQVTSVFGEEANEQKLKSLPTEEYRYLHFATHGVLGSHIPGLDEPALVLSEEAEGSENDGYLTMSEVEKMKLNSDLVVLSACDTGSGKYLNGEGVMGLSRGFLLAGSRSVIASLWPVASGPTVKFMSQFYKHLKSGKSKSESLRLTQLAFMNEGEGMSGAGERGVTVAKGEDTMNLSHPSYWAPFVLIGE
jgi:CHAT domain-containing protein